MQRPHPWCSFLFLVTCLLSATGAGAAHGPHTWTQRLDESDALLRAGDYEAAYEITAPLHREVGRALISGGEHTLGTVLARHALAAAGTGRTEEALWYWHFAQSLKPDLRTLDLATYGAAGELLAPHRLAAGGEGGCAVEVRRSRDDAPLDLDPRTVTPPVKIHTPPIRYRDAVRGAGLRGKVVIQTVINREGRTHAARLLHADSPSLAYRTFEALREWRFEPARMDEEPVSVYYNLTVNFDFAQ